MSYTNLFVEVHQPSTPLYPALKTATTHNTVWIPMANHQRIVFLILIGAMTALSTVDFHVHEALSAAGGTPLAIAGAAITQLTQAGGDGNDLLAVEVRTEELTVNTDYAWVQGSLVIGTDTCYAAVLPLRFIPNYPPVVTTGWTETVSN